MAKKPDKPRASPGSGEEHRRRKTMFKGIPVVPGIALGPVRLKFRQTQGLSDRTIGKADVAREHDRLSEAVRLSKEQLLEARAKVAEEIGELEATIFDAHIAMLEDQKFLRNITIAVEDVAQIDQTQEAVTELLKDRHRTVDFQIRNMASIIEAASDTQNTLTILLGAVAAISLLVGGIGVMNIMLVSVTERTREIGIRMATGARMRNIMEQFLTEALLVSSLGGLLGVAAGLGTAWAISKFGTPIVLRRSAHAS